MTKKQKNQLRRLILAGGLFVLALVLPKAQGWAWAYFVPVYLFIGYDVLLDAGRNILHGQYLDEQFLMAVATLGAWGVGEYPEAVGVMLFYQVGEFFQSYAVNKSRKSIADLMEIRPDYANVLREGSLMEVDPEEVAVGECIVIKPGERVPLDGVVTEGESLLDTLAITGEAVPRSIGVGQEIFSGCVNQTGLLTVQVTKAYGESTVARILELVENSADNKARSEAFISRFARWYTPAVVGAAVLLMVLPSLITGEWRTWVYRGLMFLMVSCPCALVISVPLSYFGGIGAAARKGILVKGSNYLEQMGKVQTVAFDKTGTLTTGELQVTGTYALPPVAPEELLRLAAAAEDFSSHPIAQALTREQRDLPPAGKVQETAGHGVTALVENKQVAVGSKKLMESLGIPCPEPQTPGTVSFVAMEGQYAGYIAIGDRIKPGAKEALEELQAVGVHKTVLLTGDRQSAGEALGRELGLTEARCELLPQQKVTALEELLQEPDRKGTVCYVGDGINDAPVLKRADVGVAMGALGADAAIEAADIVLMDDDPKKLALAVGIARFTQRIVKQNISFALVVKGLVLITSALGVTDMWMAVLADVGVAMLAVLNAMRCLRYTRNRLRLP